MFVPQAEYDYLMQLKKADQDAKKAKANKVSTTEIAAVTPAKQVPIG